MVFASRTLPFATSLLTRSEIQTWLEIIVKITTWIPSHAFGDTTSVSLISKFIICLHGKTHSICSECYSKIKFQKHFHRQFNSKKKQWKNNNNLFSLSFVRSLRDCLESFRNQISLMLMPKVKSDKKNYQRKWHFILFHYEKWHSSVCERLFDHFVNVTI